MEFKQLEAFVYVVDHKSFSKAAESLFLTQPTVSQHVVSLEREVGTKLIVRTTKTVYPSRAGKVLYRYAKEMLSLRQRATESLIQFQKEFEGSVSIGASSILVKHFLPPLMAAFSKEYKSVQYQIFTSDSIGVVQKISDGEIEVGLTGILVQSAKCVSEHLTDDKWIVITPNSSRYDAFGSGGFPVEQLTRERVILRQPGSGFQKDIQQFLDKLGVDSAKLQVVAEIEDTESIINMVSNGMGISIVSRRAAQAFERFGKIRVFDFDRETEPRKLYIVRHKNTELTPVARLFYDFALAYYSMASHED